MRRTRRSVLATTAVAASTAGCLGLPESLSSSSGDVGIDPVEDVDPPVRPDGVAQFRGSLERWGYYPEATVPDAVEQAWRLPEINTGDHTAAKASPTPLPDGGVLVPGDAGYLTAVDPDGSVRWRGETDMDGRGIHGTAAVAGGRAYIGAYDGVLYAFDLDSGDLDWKTNLGGSIGSSPLYYDGLLLVAVEFPLPDGLLVAVDAESGEKLWADPDHRPTDHPHSTPALSLSEDAVVCGSNDGYCYCWNASDLSFRWRFATNEGAIKGPIATYDGAAFFGSWDHNVYRVDLETGEEDWAFDTGNLSMTGPGIDPTLDTVYMGSHTGSLYALDAASGEVDWEFDTGGRPITGCPTVCADRILVGSKNETLHGIDKESGEEIWEVTHDGVVTSTPRVIDGAIYYAERAPDPEDGRTDGGAYKLVPSE